MTQRTWKCCSSNSCTELYRLIYLNFSRVPQVIGRHIQGIQKNRWSIFTEETKTRWLGQQNCGTEFKLPVEKWLWSRWGENDNVLLDQKLSLSLPFGRGCCFEDVGAAVCGLPAGHQVYWEEIRILSFTGKTRHLPENSRTAYARSIYPSNDIFPRISLHSFRMHHWLAEVIIRSTLADQHPPEEGSWCGATSGAFANAFPVRNSFSPHNYHNSWTLSLSLSLCLSQTPTYFIPCTKCPQGKCGWKESSSTKMNSHRQLVKKYENHIFPKTRTPFPTSLTNP